MKRCLWSDFDEDYYVLPLSLTAGIRTKEVRRAKIYLKLHLQFTK